MPSNGQPYDARPGGNVNPNPAPPSVPPQGTQMLQNIQLPNKGQQSSVGSFQPQNPRQIAQAIMRGRPERPLINMDHVNRQRAATGQAPLSLTPEMIAKAGGADRFTNIPENPLDAVNIKQPVTVPPEQQEILTEMNEKQPVLPQSLNQDEYTNPFESFRKNMQGLVSKMSGFEGGEEYMKEIFQGQDPQVFFNNLANTFGASWQHLGNKPIGLMRMFGQGDR